MMCVRHGFAALALALAGGTSLPIAALAQEAAEVVSPDGSVRLRVKANAGRLEYAVTFKNQPVIETSPMQMTLDGVSLSEGATLGDVQVYQLDETYPTRGVHS